MEPTTPEPEQTSLFDKIVNSTPILLTVIATFILGQSSGEMTKAQYQRAVASQKQSKVGDQWAFFQAKRIRGTTYEATAVTLLAQKADPFTAETLLDSAQGLIREIQLSEKELKADPLLDQLKTLEKKADAALTEIKAALNPTNEGWNGKRLKLEPADVKTALSALEAYTVFKEDKTADADATIPAEQRKLLDEILHDVKQFKPEKEAAPKTLDLKAETLEKAMKEATAKAAKVTARGKKIDRILEEFDILVDRQAALMRDYQRLLANHLSTRIKGNADADELAKLERRLDRARSLSARLLADYKAARYAFDARRYEDDARSNQDAAFLYDVQVLQSSALSDRHLGRSFGFMIAMLIAQVGVTIGTVAIALRFKVPVWLIAAFAGLAAIVFGAYVYLELGPLL